MEGTAEAEQGRSEDKRKEIYMNPYYVMLIP